MCKSCIEIIFLTFMSLQVISSSSLIGEAIHLDILHNDGVCWPYDTFVLKILEVSWTLKVSPNSIGWGKGRLKISQLLLFHKPDVSKGLCSSLFSAYVAHLYMEVSFILSWQYSIFITWHFILYQVDNIAFSLNGQLLFLILILLHIIY